MGAVEAAVDSFTAGAKGYGIARRDGEWKVGLGEWGMGEGRENEKENENENEGAESTVV